VDIPTPEESNFTSTQERLFNHAKRVRYPSWQQKYLVQKFKRNVIDQRDSNLKQARLKALNGSFLHPYRKAPLLHGRIILSWWLVRRALCAQVSVVPR